MTKSNEELMQERLASFVGQSFIDLVHQPTENKLIRSRVVRGGFKAPYVSFYDVVQRVNAVTCYLNSFKVNKAEVVNDSEGYPFHVWVQGSLSILFPGKEEIVEEYHPDGSLKSRTINKVESIELTRDNFGGTDVKYTKDGILIDIGDDLKSAAADCYKKCASQFEFFLDIYGTREKLEEPVGLDDSQLKVLNRKLKEAKVDRELFDKMCEKTFGKSVDEVQIGSLARIYGMLGKIAKGEAKITPAGDFVQAGTNGKGSKSIIIGAKR